MSFLRKVNLSHPGETDEQCVRALWFMDRTGFSGAAEGGGGVREEGGGFTRMKGETLY